MVTDQSLLINPLPDNHLKPSIHSSNHPFEQHLQTEKTPTSTTCLSSIPSTLAASTLAPTLSQTDTVFVVARGASPSVDSAVSDERLLRSSPFRKATQGVKEKAKRRGGGARSRFVVNEQPSDGIIQRPTLDGGVWEGEKKEKKKRPFDGDHLRPR